jgi:hypothetical protein
MNNNSNSQQALFIAYPSDPLLASLSQNFAALVSVKDSIAAHLAEVKDRNGERIGKNLSRDSRDPKTRERERAYEVAVLRLEIANSGLRATAAALHADVEAVRTALTEQKNSGPLCFGVARAVAQNNCLCAVELIDEALSLHHTVVYKHLFPFRWHYFGIERTFAAIDERDNPREFVVMSSGHGSKLRFDGANPDEPPAGPYLTFEEAKAEALHWCSYADTIGGGASVYNVRTKAIAQHY